MKRAIYQIQEDDTLKRMDEETYLSEDQLQEFLGRYPDLLAGDQIDENNPRRWVLVDREVGVPSEEGGGDRWSLDHLFLDQDGIPTLVEVKRSTDGRIRREVVGQMLDYAANAVIYWPIEVIRARFEATCEAAEQSPVDTVAELLQIDEPDKESLIEDFWAQVKTNLQAGRIRLLFVADRIPAELRRIVEFLNTQMDPAEVLAVEIKRYVGDDVETLVPNVIGHTAVSAGKRSRSPSRQWDEPSFFVELERRCGAEDARVGREILEWAKDKMPAIWWGRGARSGGFIPGVKERGIWHQLIEVWTYGRIEIQFQYMKSRSDVFNDEDARLELLRRLNQVPGVDLSESEIVRRPSILLSLLRDDEVREKFLRVLGWAVQEIGASGR